MPIYKPTELRAFLTSLGAEPKKGLSQNFLIDGNILRKIIAIAEVQPGDVVLEIGPGPGSLTQMLLEAGAVVIAVEKDLVLANALERLQTADKRLIIYQQDIMTFPWSVALKATISAGKKAKVIANLPYHLTTPIITSFSPHYESFSSLVVMVQEEVGRRMTAKPGTPDYSALTLFLDMYTNSLYASSVSKNSFYPVPKVNSAVIRLCLKKPILNEEELSIFFKMTRSSFEQRRKMLRSSLKDLYSPSLVEEALNFIKKPVTTRPEELSLEDFLAIFRFLNSEILS